MTHATQRETLAAKYARAVKRGDRATAARIWPRLAAATNAMLAGQ